MLKKSGKSTKKLKEANLGLVVVSHSSPGAAGRADPGEPGEALPRGARARPPNQIFAKQVG